MLDDSVIDLDESYIEPEIILIDKTPKQFIKHYKLAITSQYMENTNY